MRSRVPVSEYILSAHFRLADNAVDSLAREKKEEAGAVAGQIHYIGNKSTSKYLW